MCAVGSQPELVADALSQMAQLSEELERRDESQRREHERCASLLAAP